MASENPFKSDVTFFEVSKFVFEEPNCVFERRGGVFEELQQVPLGLPLDLLLEGAGSQVAVEGMLVTYTGVQRPPGAVQRVAGVVQRPLGVVKWLPGTLEGPAGAVEGPAGAVELWVWAGSEA